METIINEKNKLEKLKKDVLRQSNEKKIIICNEIQLITVEENIALWWKKSYSQKKGRYFYTNLNGEILFDGEEFEYATAFSNSCACVKWNYEWYIIDLNKRELIAFPKNIYWENINGFRNENLALLDKNTKCWGSYQYSSEEKLFEPGIPFIWSTIEFSREKNNVYVGQAEYISSYFPDPYGDEFHKDLCDIPIIKIPKKLAYNQQYYDNFVKVHKKCWIQDKVKHISIELKSECSSKQLQQEIQTIIEEAYDIADLLFEEQYKEELNNNNNCIVDVGSMSNYQRHLGKVKK